MECYNSDLKIVETHIKKTGGTSLLATFSELYNPKDVFVYNAELDSFNNIREKTPTQKRFFDTIISQARKMDVIRLLVKVRKHIPQNKRAYHVENLPDNWRVLTGHFKTQDILAKLPEDKYVLSAVIREPLARTISHYNYWRIWDKSRRDVKFEDFSFRDDIVNFQSKTLEGVDCSKIILGTTESLQKFIDRVVLTSTNKPISRDVLVPHLNGNPKPSSLANLGINDIPNFLEKFRKLNHKDYNLYGEALRQNIE